MNIINIFIIFINARQCDFDSISDGFTNFRDAFPEWCEDANIHSDTQKARESGHSDQLMGLR